jgi:hypothetical protein
MGLVGELCQKLKVVSHNEALAGRAYVTEGRVVVSGAIANPVTPLIDCKRRNDDQIDLPLLG